jgi:hypothetical protein
MAVSKRAAPIRPASTFVCIMATRNQSEALLGFRR